ncbi:hypothetical protein ACFWUZ_26810 [Streptomyces sp. NPDC058646]|uniref:hypothetical protein n=1 Tax=Streptomyces sp. NPDC058646 TaxID=3346574 RepID=UPI0036576BA6
MLKNADFLSGFTDEFPSIAAYERIDRPTCSAGCGWPSSRWARTGVVKYATALPLGTAEAEQVLRRLTRGGLQVVENWNSANTVLHYGKGGALTGPDKEHAETSMLALYLLQSALDKRLDLGSSAMVPGQRRAAGHSQTRSRSASDP